jgi:putative inorganic carbon (HCO3(-)) transporter
MAWIKSGGLEIHASLLVVLVLLLAPSLIAKTEARETIAARRPRWPAPRNRLPTSLADATG